MHLVDGKPITYVTTSKMAEYLPPISGKRNYCLNQRKKTRQKQQHILFYKIYIFRFKNLKVCKIKYSKSYVGRGLKKL